MSANLQPTSTLLRQNQPRSFHCTHRNLTRIYNKHDQQKCAICGRVPDLGYLYRCTQETHGNLPIADFLDEDLAIDLGKLDIHDHELKSQAWKASNSPRSKTFPENQYSSRRSTADILRSMNMGIATDEVLARTYDGKRKFEAAFPMGPVHGTAECEFKICHTCRPTYKERAWQSIGGIVDSTPILPSQHEFDNRRISDASILINMQPTRQLTPTLKTTPVAIHKVDVDERIKILAKCESLCSKRRTSFSHKHSHGQHKTSAMSEKASQIESFSDADDEKGFGQQEEDSDSSSANNECVSGSHSELEDALSSRSQDHARSSYSPAQRPRIPYDREKIRPVASAHLSEQKPHHGMDDRLEDALKRVKNGRLEYGRFVID